ncbi:hypothetical protein [Streptomyces sp. WM6386]|uniref:hypothetical protein n=1 Tax=Streptomyces sp. WM6386 TaxID=1415558 RepID=UPI00061946D0|nr:hypothetical protein [Streptomyces sp. WM6386]KKD07623.1 hypothetical protein TN53_11840 [Streptomyces sp. WM6386]
MTNTTSPQGGEPCAQCAEFERLKAQAKDEGDYSKATDYQVLIDRHPTHDPHQQPTPRAKPSAPRYTGPPVWG